jgi:hypothetical protein
MARPILDYTSKGRKESSVDCGGVLPGDERDVNKYRAPTGPTNIDDRKGPGLHGTMVGNAGTQGTYGKCQTSGSPGIGGERKSQGSQRSR